MMRKLGHNILLLGMVALTALLALVVLPSQAGRADIAGSVTPPGISQVPSGTSFLSPQIGSGNAKFNVTMNWQSLTSTDDSTRYAVVYPGQTIHLYTSFNYNGTATAYYRTARQYGSSATVTSAGGKSQGGGTSASLGIEAVNSDYDRKKSNDIQYLVTAPSDITSPTWVFYQVQFRGGNTIFDSYVGSAIFPMLVLPTGYDMTNAALTSKVVFTGSKTTYNLDPLPSGLTASLSTAVTPTGAGAWNGAAFTAGTLAGLTTGTYNFPVSAPHPNTATPAVADSTFTKTDTAYVGHIADQSVSEGDDATFRIELPDGLTAQNIKWQMTGGTTLTSTALSCIVPGTTTAQSGQTVTATMDVYKDGTLLQGNVSGTAKLTVTPTPVSLTINPQLIFSGSGAPTNTAQATGTVTGVSNPTLTWSGSDASLATINSAGVITANAEGKTGTYQVTGTYTNGTATPHRSQSITVGRLATPAPIAVGKIIILTAPTKDNSGWTYQWQRKAEGDATWANLSGATATMDTYAAEATQMDDGAQYRVVVTTGTATATSNPVTLSVNPEGLNLVQVPDYTFKHAESGPTVDQMTNPTVADLINGTYSGGTINWNDPIALYKNWLMPTTMDNIIVSDTRGANATFSVSMQVSPFKNGSHYLSTANGGSATLAMVNPSGTQTTQIDVHDDNTSVTLISGASAIAAQGDRYSLALAPMLALQKAPRATAGTYSSTVTWTTTAGPDN